MDFCGASCMKGIFDKTVASTSGTPSNAGSSVNINGEVDPSKSDLAVMPQKLSFLESLPGLNTNNEKLPKKGNTSKDIAKKIDWLSLLEKVPDQMRANIVLGNAKYHVIEQLYYNSELPYQPNIWKRYDPESFVVVKKDLARGTTGKIDLVIHKKSHYLGVLKIVTSMRRSEARTEFNILNSCRECPFIIRVIDGFEAMKTHYILTEYAPFLTLDHLTQVVKGLGTDNARLFTLEMIIGLSFLHSKNIMHRDIKPENVFILLSGHVVIGDMGSAYVMDRTDYAEGMCATYVTRAPEVWERKRYTKSADIWSLGVTVYNIISNKWPFLSPSQKNQIDKVKSGIFSYTEKFCNVSQDFIKQMLQVDPQLRPSCHELLQHEFFKNVKHPYDPPFLSRTLLRVLEKICATEIITKLLGQTGSNTDV